MDIFSYLTKSDKIDIMALNETWLDGTDADKYYIQDLCAEDYTFYTLLHFESRGGCVGMLFNKSLMIKRKPSCDFSSFETIDVLLTSPGKNLRIVNIYQPPPSATNNLSVTLYLTEFSQFLEQLVITTTPLVIKGWF